jgi:predicted NBD/HSP70 family sugar kinase
LGELIFGAGRNVRDAVYLWLGDGIGAGLMIDGRLHHGFTSSAGEIGYNSVVQPSQARTSALLLNNGQQDVGDVLSEANIARALGLSSSRTMRSGITARLQSRDQQADQVLREIGDVVGELCITLVNTLNPEAILLGGDLFWHVAPLVEAVEEKVKRDVLGVPAEAVRISVSALKEDGVLLGSVGHVLFDLFRPTQESKNSAAA